jgi:hypothetical protein
MRKSTFLRDFLENLFSGLRLIVSARISHLKFHISHGQAIAFFLLMILLDGTADWIKVEPEREFNIYGVSALATLYFIYLVSLYLITSVERNHHSFIALLVMTLAPYPFIYLLDQILRTWLLVEMTIDHRLGWFVLGLGFSLTLLATGRAMYLLYQPRITRLSGYLAIFAMINFGAVLIMPNQALWFGQMEDIDSRQSTAINVEDTFYAQPMLMTNALSRVQPGNPSKTELFYLGYSPYASHDVFVRESKSIQQLINERFDTLHRSLLLLNHRSTYRETPLATAYNLAHALAAFSDKMDDEDILFLYLTSHGAREINQTHALAASFWPLQVNDLSAEKLARLLDRSNIRWRIIIVSACYSGGFIDDQLKSPETLIITASALDKASFGCSPSYRYTHFAKAYFDEALRQNGAFIDAFHDAAKRIRQKEIEQGLEHSEPQIFIGKAIRQKLAEL